MVDDFTLYGTFKKGKYLQQNTKPRHIISNHANEKSFSFFFVPWVYFEIVHLEFFSFFFMLLEQRMNLCYSSNALFQTNERTI